MNRNEAAHALAACPNPHARAVFSTRDATGHLWIEVRCWLDDGVLVMPHPTDLGHWPIAAPDGVDYTLWEPSAEEMAWREEQERLSAAGR